MEPAPFDRDGERPPEADTLGFVRVEGLRRRKMVFALRVCSRCKHVGLFLSTRKPRRKLQARNLCWCCYSWPARTHRSLPGLLQGPASISWSASRFPDYNMDLICCGELIGKKPGTLFNFRKRTLMVTDLVRP